jgi:uncharacterized protein
MDEPQVILFSTFQESNREIIFDQGCRVGFFVLAFGMKQSVLITGASQGIGYEFAKLFAAAGQHLVLVARDEQRLRQVAEELSARHGITAKPLAKDLSKLSAAQEIFDELKREQIEISILVNNAGFGFQGPFEQLDLQKHLDLVQVNITTLAQLTHLFVKPMLARHSGRILNVASTAAFLPGPFLGMYYASKAFVLSFSRALAEELAGSGVTVTVLCPGITQSQFHARAGLKRQAKFITMSAEEVARIGYYALTDGKAVVVAGWMNKISVAIMKLTPVSWLTFVAAKINRQPNQ